ncbi:hypothetical protein GCM10027416_13000 [Okibacterium endophyticum]
MTWVLGCLLAAGALLTVAPWLWPRGRATVTASSGRRRPLAEKLARAGFARVPVAMFVVVSVLVAAVAGAVALATLGVVAVAVAAACFGAVAPYAAVTWRENQRRSVHDALWPDVLDHLVSAVRSGVALPDAVASLGRSGPAALRPEFAEFERDYRLTGSFTDSLDRLKGALADPVPDRIIETVRMAREVGGTDLTGILRNLAAYLREDSAIRSEVSARQSWVRNAAKLGAAAPWIVLLLLSTRPEAQLAYNSAGGTALILVGAAVSMIAYRLMVSIGRLPREKRWFG